ncbi:type II toxin-antitoxin system HipA family toxin [Pelagibacterium luteolum]|uniref:Serine/threonine-protein kinase HipA n=1 Tax=Pelagibacterium luteolum TaxID=440168 RepID=A0A1G8AMN3_9HYPH|nr:type II toxin-antitoxin system HipA family toxin [Pelagibacterium luteolum]SDH22204.1 serine/threonine-protein kinase HipA [Pelagibacterium luteolum]
MVRRKQNPPLRVILNGREVGTLSRATSGAIDFRYASEWLAWENAIPVSLSLPLREDRYIGAPVIAVFDNLLPDNRAIRDRVAARVGAQGTDAYSMLARIGKDCVGALQFLPDDTDVGYVGSLDGNPISDAEIARKLRNIHADPLGLDEEEDFRISIAGAQEKTALLFNEGRWFTPKGITATTHILKPQIGMIPNGIDLSNSVENEFICLKLCEALGLETTKAEIVEFEDQKVLCVERFDRIRTRDGRLLRLPQEDMCQALSVPPNLKYQADGGPDNQHIMKLLKGSDKPDADQLSYLRAQILFWLLGATDGHAKNFSVFLMPGQRFQLTPTYDILTAQPSVDAGQVNLKKYKLAMSVGKTNHYRINEIQPRHLLQTAERCNFDPRIVQQEFERLLETAEETAASTLNVHSAAIPDELADSVLAGVTQRLRALSRWNDDAEA